MKYFILFLSLILTAIAQSVSVGPDGSTLVISRVATNVVIVTRPELKSYEQNLLAQIAKLQAELDTIKGYLVMADTLKIADPVSTNRIAVTTNTVISITNNVPIAEAQSAKSK